MDGQLKKELEDMVASPVALDEPLSRYTTFGIGGPAKAVVRVQSAEELSHVLGFCSKRSLPWRILGKGSNIVVSDAGFKGIIMLLDGQLKKIHAIERQTCNVYLIHVGAGCSFSRLLSYCHDQEMAGLEFAAGLPGTLGGAVIMNAGAWGQSLGDHLTSVEVVSIRGKEVYGREQLSFSYRMIKGIPVDAVVTGVTVQVVPGHADDIAERCRSLLQRRKMGQPLSMPNAGSIFKNPPGESAGRLIENSGLKGVKVGDAQVSEIHANFIVNLGKARAADVLELIERIQRTVATEKGILLEPEVHLLC